MAKRRRRHSSSPSNKRNRTPKTMKIKDAKSSKVLCFQDVWREHLGSELRESKDAEPLSDVSNVFFELANTPSVSYRLEATHTNDHESKNNTIEIQQDVSGAAETHTGGIVWETSYLLLNYLLASNKWLENPTSNTRTILEIGAGCGMLGLSLHKAFELGMIEATESSRVIITETDEVMDNLRCNLEHNCPLPSSIDEDKDPAAHHTVSVDELDWTRYQTDCSKADIDAHSIDCIVGTDVVFSTRFVLPMLETMQYLSHPQTVIYLCLQERCKDSHAMLLEKANEYGFRIDDISESVYDDEELESSCSFGRSLECKLLKFTVVATPKEKVKKSKNERKPKKEKSKKKRRPKEMLEHGYFDHFS